MKRIFNIIKRASDDFGMEVDMQDSLQDIFDNACNAITDAIDYDYVSECERGRHYDHITWDDGMGYMLEADGEFISSDDSKNTYFRKDEKGEFHEIEWFEHNENDYILMEHDFDTNGQRVALVCL